MSNPSSTLRGGRKRKFKAEINVVPYIDVMLVLLVIFMVAAPLANPNVIDLPTAAKSTLPPTEYIQVALKPDVPATLAISGKPGGVGSQSAAPVADLVEELRALHVQYPELPLMISADKNMKYEEVIKVISEAKKLGISRVGLATN